METAFSDGPGLDPSGVLPSPTSARFRALVLYFMSPAQTFRLHSYKDGEAQLRDERTGKQPVFVVIINGGRDDERSLRVRLTRLASENLTDQHIVLVANHSWMSDALRKLGQEFYPRMRLYHLTADAEIAFKPNGALPELVHALKAQARTPTTNMPESEFAALCENAEAEKQRLADRYGEALALRGTPFTFAVLALLLGLYGLARLWQTPQDTATVLVQLGARIAPLVRAGQWWRLLASSFLHPGLQHLLLDALVLLSIGHQAEKLLGTAQAVALYTICALVGSLCGMYAPGAAALSLGIGAGGALWGVLGAMGVLALWPEGLPIAVGQRLRWIVLSSLVVGVVLSFLPSVDRAAHVGGAVVGALLMFSGALRPLQVRDAGRPAAGVRRWLQLAAGAVCGLLLFGSLAIAVAVGKPWQPDRTWKQRLGASALDSRAQRAGGSIAAAADPGGTAEGGPPHADLRPAQRSLGEAGYAITLPQGLGEARALTAEGKVPVFQFGDLGAQLQALDVVVQKQPKPLKKPAQLRQALDQSAAILRADKLRGEATELTPATKPMLDGLPSYGMHLRLQESVQGKGLVLARRDAVIVLWYTYSDLLPENLQLDLAAAAQSVKDEFAGYGSARGKKGGKAGKGKRKRR